MSLLILALVAIVGAETPEKLPMQLLMEGLSDESFCTAASGEEWWGLFKKDKGYELQPCRVNVKRGVPGPYEAVDVTTDRSQQALFLVKGLKNPEAGPVKSLFHGEKFLFPGETMPYGGITLCVSGRVPPPPADGTWYDPVLKDYALYFSANARTKVVMKLDEVRPFFYGPVVEWVGDLDRDGKPDFLINLAADINEAPRTLFLSSESEDGTFPALVAVFAGAHGV